MKRRHHPPRAGSITFAIFVVVVFICICYGVICTNKYLPTVINMPHEQRAAMLTHSQTHDTQHHNITKRSFSYYIFSCTWLIYGFISSVHSNLNVVAVDGTALFFLCSPLYHRATRKALSWLDLYPSYRTRLANLNDIETCRKKKTPAVWRADE